jgi:hypothetical protein
MPEVNAPSFGRAARTVPGLSGGTDWSAGKDTAGIPILYPSETVTYRANEALVPGDVVSLIAATSTAPVSVRKTLTTDKNSTILGACTTTTAAGDDAVISVDVGWCKATAAVADAALVAVKTTTGQFTTEATNLSYGTAAHAAGIAIGAAVANFYGSGNYGVLVKFRDT